MRAVVLVLGALLLAGCGGQSAGAERTVLLLSGRDDHGLVVQQEVGLSDWIGGDSETKAPDGTLVRVEATHGEWIEVQALEGRPVRGWVNDYYLRGTAHLTRRVAPFGVNTQVELLDVNGSSVRVRALETEQVGWVPRHVVAENPAPR